MRIVFYDTDRITKMQMNKVKKSGFYRESESENGLCFDERKKETTAGIYAFPRKAKRY